MFKKDVLFIGVIIGIITPFVVYLIVHFGLYLAENILQKQELLDTLSKQILSIVPNLLIFRYYFVKLKFEKTGRGMLLATFVIIILCFLIDRGTSINL